MTNKERLEYSINEIEYFYKKIEEIARRYNLKINEDSEPFYYSYYFDSKTTEPKISCNEIELSSKHIEKISIKDFMNIKDEISSLFKYGFPIEHLRISIGEIVKETDLDYDYDDEPIYYETERFNPVVDFYCEKYKPIEDVYKKKDINKSFSISYSLGEQRLSSYYNNTYIDNNKEFKKIRSKDNFFNEIYTIFYKHSFDMFPESIEENTKETENNIKLLNKDYNKLKKYIDKKVNNKDYILFEKPELKFVFLKQASSVRSRKEQDVAGLFLYVKGVLDYYPSKQSNYTFNVVEGKTILDSACSIFSKKFKPNDELYQLIKKYTLTEDEKKDTYEYFTKLTEEYVVSSFKDPIFYDDLNISLDINLNKGNIAKIVRNYSPKKLNNGIFLYNTENDLIGYITGDLPEDINVDLLKTNLNTLISQITKSTLL